MWFDFSCPAIIKFKYNTITQINSSRGLGLSLISFISINHKRFQVSYFFARNKYRVNNCNVYKPSLSFLISFLFRLEGQGRWGDFRELFPDYFLHSVLYKYNNSLKMVFS